jgi:hypothetical protein
MTGGVKDNIRERVRKIRQKVIKKTHTPALVYRRITGKARDVSGERE